MEATPTAVVVPRRGNAQHGQKIMGGGRKQARRRGIRHGIGGPHGARFRSGIGTGTTPHFETWKREGLLKSILQRTKLVDLAENHSDTPTATAYALLHGGGVKTVWDLARSNINDLLSVKGFGKAKLMLVQKDLRTRNVPTDW